jgi:hypothetical protein
MEKMKNLRRTVSLSLIVILALVGVVQMSEAATLTGFWVTNTMVGATCLDSTWEIYFGWTGVTADFPDGNDGVGMIAFDGNGVPIAADWDGFPPGATLNQTTPFGGGLGINDLTARPVTIQLFDFGVGPYLPFGENTQAIYDDIVARGDPVAAEIVYDPASDDPNCAALPFGSGGGGADGSAAVAEPLPGCDVLINIPDQAVMGTFTDYALVYWMPGEATYPPVVIDAGKSYLVTGLDESSMYYQVLLSCEWVWVEAGLVGPTYDDVWGGQALPTDIVESIAGTSP